MTESPLHSDGFYFLKRNPLFNLLDEEALGHLVDHLKPQLFDKNITIFREGEAGTGLYLLRSGRVRVSSTNNRGEEKTVTFLSRRGDAIGELSLLAGEPYPVTVLTDSACEFLVLSKQDFDAILEAHPLVGIQISRALSRRLAVSFQSPSSKPKLPEWLALFPALPHEATILFTLNLAISLVEQTRRKVLLLDLSQKSGDIARALGLNPPAVGEAQFRSDDLLDASLLHRFTTIHPSGLEILSFHPKVFHDQNLATISSLATVAKDHYDFTLVLTSTERDPLTEAIVKEASKVLLVTWDQAPDLAARAQAEIEGLAAALATPVDRILLHNPDALTLERADFRVPWSETFHQPFRASGTPYLSVDQAGSAIAALDRIGRAIGKLRVGLAMGSGAAYGYALIGLLKVFEREGIPIDLVAGTSMGALLGSFYCAGNSPGRIEEIAAGITKGWMFANMLGDVTIPHSGLLAGHTLSAFLRSILGNTEFHQLRIPFAAVATDIRSGHEIVLKEGKVADAVRASTSLPILFTPFLRRGRFLVDGGLVNPVPTSIVAKMGADILISVNLTAKPSIRRGLGRYRRTFPLAPKTPRLTEVFFKMIYTMQYEIAQARTEIAHVVIAPDTRGFLWTDFHRSAEIIKVGEAAAQEAVPKIKNLLPFFADYCKVPLGISLRAY